MWMHITSCSFVDVFNFSFGQLNLNDLTPPPINLFNLKVEIPESNS